MAKRKNMMDMTPACERGGKVAPVDEKLSTPNWTVYRTKETCECGGNTQRVRFWTTACVPRAIRRPTMHDEYISREAAIEEIDKWLDTVGTALVGKGLSYYGELIGCIEDARAADVAEVVHGQWYMLDDCANAGLYCSACGRRVHHEEFAYKKLKSKYCPNCGAKMDGATE